VGRRGDYYGVLRAADVPAVIVELAFLTNPREEAYLREQWYQEKAALGLVMGLYHYLSMARRPSGDRRPTREEPG